MNSDPVAEAYGIAKRVAHGPAPGPWDRVERESIAGLAVAELLAAGRPLDKALIGRTVRRRLVDELRKQIGRTVAKPLLVELGPWHDSGVSESPWVWPWVDGVMDDMHASTCRRLADGWTRSEIAAADGVTKGALTHRLRTIRQRLENQ